MAHAARDRVYWCIDGYYPDCRNLRPKGNDHSINGSVSHDSDIHHLPAFPEGDEGLGVRNDNL